jgi:hypothetical protein
MNLIYKSCALFSHLMLSDSIPDNDAPGLLSYWSLNDRAFLSR